MRSYFSFCSNINIVQQTASQELTFHWLESYLYELHFVRYIKTNSAMFQLGFQEERQNLAF